MLKGTSPLIPTVLRLLLFLFIFALPIIAQTQKGGITTIILTRHAEKDMVDKQDPELTEPGKWRAARLAGIFPNAKPDELYSTPYKRTVATLQPWATITGLTIKNYNPADLATFADELKTKKNKTIVVCGHSNTTPSLANLLLGEEKYKSLSDDEYNKIFVITIVKGKAKGKVLEY